MNAASVAVPLFTFQTARRHPPIDGGHGARSARLCPPYETRFSLLTSLLLPFLHFTRPLREGRAERRWRLDACDAPRSACHDRHADASLDRQPGRARLAFIAHLGKPLVAIDFANRRTGLRETSCVPGDGDARLAALHVGFL